MSRKRGDRDPSRAEIKPGPPSPRRGTPAARDRLPPGRAKLLIIIAAVAIAAAAFLASRVGREKPPVPPSDPAASMAAEDAYHEAYLLTVQNRLRESLPYFRRALAGLTTDFPEIHYVHAVALAALSMQYLPRTGTPMPAVPSSVRRVALVQQALAELDRAADLARDPRALTLVLTYRAHVLRTWGLPWETLTAYQRARLADRTNDVAVLETAQFLRVMRDPDRARSEEPSLELGAAQAAKPGAGR